MIFHSLDFIVFFVLVVAVYWALPFRRQNAFLLAVSWLFYGYVSPWFLGPLAVATVADFFIAKGIARYRAQAKLLIWASLAVNLGMLGIFKYFGFFVDNMNAVLSSVGLTTFELGLSIVMPVGISFYALQSIGYTVDVYRKQIAPCRSLIDYALYVSFFPQLVAGPIERSTHLIPMITSLRSVDAGRITSGLQLMLWGFFKKVVVADTVAVTANKIFALDEPNFALLWVGVFAFAIQIFADFSAYTDIARGSARILGFELMENFRGPYLSQSPHEFWGRWHISLSSWIRDYVYIPLGGSRRGPGRNMVNLIGAFAVSGLWHGAQWNFVLWGLYWSFLTIGYRFVGVDTQPFAANARSIFSGSFKVVVMFLLTCFGWLLFRETNPDYLWKYILTDPLAVTHDQLRVALFLGIHAAIFALPLFAYDVLCRLPSRVIHGFQNRPVVRRGTELAVACLLFFGILILRSNAPSEFIYFQF